MQTIVERLGENAMALDRAEKSARARASRSIFGHPSIYTDPVRLRLEIALARAVGRLSRLTRRGGGTTLPGKLLANIDPGAVSTLAARLPLGCALISATNGKTTTAA